MSHTDEAIQDLIHEMYTTGESTDWGVTAEDVRSRRGRRGLPTPDLKVLLLVAAAVVLVVVGIGVARESHTHKSTASGPTTTTSSTAARRTVSVPTGAVGTEVASARALMSVAGLKVTTRYVANTSTTGTVLAQTPAPGAVVNRGSTVTLTVSSGLAVVRVPTTVGMSQVQAGSILGATGLTVGSVTTIHSTIVSAGDVASQNPAADSSVPPGSSVDLAVSSGP
jgi:beta-lactam-binding protein with PASTA domain